MIVLCQTSKHNQTKVTVVAGLPPILMLKWMHQIQTQRTHTWILVIQMRIQAPASQMTRHCLYTDVSLTSDVINFLINEPCNPNPTNLRLCVGQRWCMLRQKIPHFTVFYSPNIFTSPTFLIYGNGLHILAFCVHTHLRLQFGKFFHRKIWHKLLFSRCTDFSSKCTTNRLAAGLRPDQQGELTALPQTP